MQSVITKNFESFSFAPLAYYLSLYPVFALTTNFPLIAITLRNNLMTIVSAATVGLGCDCCRL